MSEIKFSDNYKDLSKNSGVNAGFQFEFFCEQCNDTWRSPFVPYKRGQVSGWLGKIAGMVGVLSEMLAVPWAVWRNPGTGKPMMIHSVKP